jgi:hypothetical protein
MGFPLPNHVLLICYGAKTRAKPSGTAQGLKKAHDNDTPLVAIAVHHSNNLEKSKP